MKNIDTGFAAVWGVCALIDMAYGEYHLALLAAVITFLHVRLALGGNDE
jgi:hypothetical protein